MAVSLDVAVSAAADPPSGSNTFTNFMTIAANADRVLYVWVGTNDGGAAIPTGVTWNGVAMTKIAECTTMSDQSMSLWRLINPDSGLRDLVVSSSLSFVAFVVLAASLYGVDQTTPEGTPATQSNTGTSLSVAPTGVAGGYPLGGAIYWQYGTNPTFTSGAGQTRLLTSASSGGGSYAGALDTETPIAGAQSLSFTMGGDSYASEMIGVGVRPSAGGAAASRPIYRQPRRFITARR